MNTRDRIAHYLRQLAPHVRAREAAQLLEAALVTIDRLQALADTSRHYAMHYLQDERDDPDLCHDEQHHADVVAMWDALDGIPSDASNERPASAGPLD